MYIIPTSLFKNSPILTFPSKEITGATKRDLHLANLAFLISGFSWEISLIFTLQNNKKTQINIYTAKDMQLVTGLMNKPILGCICMACNSFPTPNQLALCQQTCCKLIVIHRLAACCFNNTSSCTNRNFNRLACNFNRLDAIDKFAANCWQVASAK